MPIYKAFNNSGEHNPFPPPLLLSRRHTRVCAGAFAFLKAFGGTNECLDVRSNYLCILLILNLQLCSLHTFLIFLIVLNS